MQCYHLIQGQPQPPIAREGWQALNVAGGYCLLVHDDCHACLQAATRLPHILSGQAAGTTLATALADYGVQVQDGILDAMLKVGAQWPAAFP